MERDDESTKTALCSKVYDAKFTAAGYRFEQISAPNERCFLMIKTGEADFYPGNIRETAFEGYVFASPQFAIWYGKGVTLLCKKRVIPEWQGVESLKMLMADRTDVMVSSSEMILATQQLLKAELSPQEYGMVYLDRVKYYPLFRSDDRGRQLAAVFDQGMQNPWRTGKLADWYKIQPDASVENIDPELAKP